MDWNEIKPDQLLGPLNEVEEKHAPKTLFAVGDTDMLRHSTRVSIVGSRKASPDGLSRARKLARILVDRGIVVVSGLAEGIDTAAHTSTIDAGGRTVAVIGTPIDKFYPKSNIALQRRIAAEHLLLSQFPVGYPTRPQNFPIRNRTMALISDATVIIEAGESSGSLSQGWEALRLGRPLFIAKSVCDDAALKWPAQMMGYGAYVLSEGALDELLDILPNRAESELVSELSF